MSALDTYGPLVLGGFSVLVIGCLLNFIFSWHFFGSKTTVGDVASYLNPVCLFKGFKGCTSNNFQALEVIVLTYILIAVIKYAVTSSGVVFINKLFPLMPIVMSAVITLMVHTLLSAIINNNWPGSTKLRSWSTYSRTLLELIVGVSTVPLGVWLAHVLKHHKKTPPTLRNLL